MRCFGIAGLALCTLCCCAEDPTNRRGPGLPIGDPTGGGDATAGDTDRRSGEVPPFGSAILSVVSMGGFSSVPPPVCTEGEWVDFNCDALLPMDCQTGGQHIDYDPTDDSPCPVCVDPDPSDPDTCSEWQTCYGEFLASLISESCANFCTHTSDCYAWEIQNACGTFAWSLRGLIDEEPIMFAETFGRENCGPACGASEQVLFLRRPGSTQVEGGTGTPTGLLYAYRPECVANQCVLVADE